MSWLTAKQFGPFGSLTSPAADRNFRTSNFGSVTSPAVDRNFRLNNFGASGNSGSNILSLLGGSVTDNLPSKQEMATTYVEAIIAFWVVGGLALYAVSKLSK